MSETDPDSKPESADVPADDLEVVSMTRAELRLFEEHVRNQTWKEARVQFERRAKGSALVTRLDQLEQFVARLSRVILDRIEGSGASPDPAAEEH